MLTHLLRSSPPEILEPTPSVLSPQTHPSYRPQTDTQLHLDSPNLHATSFSPMSETSALLAAKADRPSYGASEIYSPPEDNDGSYYLLHEHDIERQGYPGMWLPTKWFRASRQRIRTYIKSLDKRIIWEQGIMDPIHRIPAVILGLLLNILDALSYGMILFPLGLPIFEKLGPDGISMFYVSCIISQLVYSLGGSAFKGGIGSEMVR